MDVPRSCASIWAVLQPCSEFMRVLCVEFAWEHHRLSRSGWSQARIVHLVGDCNRWYHPQMSSIHGHQHLVHHLSLVREYGLAFGRDPCTRRGIGRAVLIRESWVEVVTSTRPGDSISMRSVYDGCATLVCINMGGTSAMQRVRACFVCGICGETPRLQAIWVTRGPTRAPTW